MAQYNKQNSTFLDNGTSLFEVFMQADRDGNILGSANRNDYSLDAFDRPKTILDKSLFSATFTHQIPARVWEELEFTPSTNTSNFLAGFTNATSRKGMLSVVSGTTAGTGTVLRTKRHFRYQPNRGQLFSTSVNCLNPTEAGSRLWGLTTRNDGYSFQLNGDGEDWDLVVIHRAYGEIVKTHSIKEALLAKQPDFDPSVHQLYDIQLDRATRYFINTQLIYADSHINELEFLAIEDESLTPAFGSICTEEGTEIELLVGSVDVTTEGGYDEPLKIFGSISTGLSFMQIDNTESETAIIAIKIPREISYDGRTVLQTRGAQLNKLVTWIRDEARTAVYYFRDVSATNLDGLTWNAVPDSFLLTLNGGDTSALQTAFAADKANGQLVLAEWSDLEIKNVITNPSEKADFVLTPGDIIVIAGAAIGNNKDAQATLYYAEEM